MDTITGKLVAAGVLFLITLISGFIVSHSGRPLPVGLVTLHKLIALGAMVLTGLAISQLIKTADGRLLVEWIGIIISAVLFLALVATGALLTREEMELPVLVLMIHQAAPLLALLSSAGTVFLLVKN